MEIKPFKLGATNFIVGWITELLLNQEPVNWNLLYFCGFMNKTYFKLKKYSGGFMYFSFDLLNMMESVLNSKY
jgi:hypothetical protein